MTISKELAKDLKIAQQIKEMTQTDGWKEYVRLLQLKVEEKREQALFPVMPKEGVDALSLLVLGESAKGAIMGLRLALQLPSDIINGATQVLGTLSDKDKEEIAE